MFYNMKDIYKKNFSFLKEILIIFLKYIYDFEDLHEKKKDGWTIIETIKD